MEPQDDQLLAELDGNGWVDAIASALESVIVAAESESNSTDQQVGAIVREALIGGFLDARDGRIDLSETWHHYKWLIDKHAAARAALAAGDSNAGFSSGDAAKVKAMAFGIPVALFGHAVRCFLAGRHGAAIALALHASGLVSAALGPEAAAFRASSDGRRKAKKRHAEHRDLKSEAVAYYREHRAEFKNKDEAAEFIAEEIVPLKWRTVRDYLTGV